MPLVKRFAFCAVRVNFNDHSPPHFHVLMNDGREVLVRIDTLQVVQGKVPARELDEVLAWARKHQTLLMEKFEEYR
jgi:hypothetical protein